jgi:hypothetical protein
MQGSASRWTDVGFHLMVGYWRSHGQERTLRVSQGIIQSSGSGAGSFSAFTAEAAHPRQHRIVDRSRRVPSVISHKHNGLPLSTGWAKTVSSLFASLPKPIKQTKQSLVRHQVMAGRRIILSASYATTTKKQTSHVPRITTSRDAAQLAPLAPSCFMFPTPQPIRIVTSVEDPT